MRVLIAVIAGPHQGQVFRFTGHDVFLVGRSKKAQFRLPNTDEFFSRHHFLVEVHPPSCRLIDLGSTNGTQVNGQKVSSIDLKDGDLIQGGQTVMRVTIEEEEEEPVTRRAEAPPIAPPAGPGHATLALPSIEPTLHPAEAPLTGPAAGLETGNQVKCAVCGSSAAPVVPSQDSNQTTVPPWPLCSRCRESSHYQPQPFPDYCLIRELGRGGMGIVYLALHLQQGHVVALKTIKPATASRPSDVKRFLREAGILQQLDHPHIVTFRAMGECCGEFYFAMDFVTGEDAARILKRDGPLPITRAVHLIAQALEALQYAHDRGFVHRDIKPANLLVTQVSGRDVVKVLDFGLARAYQISGLSGLTMMGQPGGTVPFMAPDQITNFREAKPPVDQYGAAASLYHLLTGEHIHNFTADFQERMKLILQGDPIPIRTRRPDIPEAVANAIHRALAREPEDRFPSVAAFRAALLPPLRKLGKPDAERVAKGGANGSKGVAKGGANGSDPGQKPGQKKGTGSAKHLAPDDAAPHSSWETPTLKGGRPRARNRGVILAASDRQPATSTA